MERAAEHELPRTHELHERTHELANSRTHELTNSRTHEDSRRLAKTHELTKTREDSRRLTHSPRLRTHELTKTREDSRRLAKTHELAKTREDSRRLTHSPRLTLTWTQRDSLSLRCPRCHHWFETAERARTAERRTRPVSAWFGGCVCVFVRQ